MVFNGLWLVVLLVIVAVLIARLWRGLTLPRGARREPACGGCGYAVRGLSELRCPECGADLREAGILTPRMLVRWRGSASGLVLAWTLLVVLVGVPAAVFLGAGVRYVDQRVMTSMVAEGNGWAVELEAHGRGRDGATRLVDLAIRLERPAGVLAGTLRVEPGLSFAVEGLDGTVQKRGESFDAAALTRWLADAGVSADGATVTGLYDAARAVIENPSKHPTAGPGMRAAGGGSASMLVVPRWYWWMVFVVLAGVWAVGCFLLFMRRRALLRPVVQGGEEEGRQAAGGSLTPPAPARAG